LGQAGEFIEPTWVTFGFPEGFGLNTETSSIGIRPFGAKGRPESVEHGFSCFSGRAHGVQFHAGIDLGWRGAKQMGEKGNGGTDTAEGDARVNSELENVTGEETAAGLGAHEPQGATYSTTKSNVKTSG